MATQPAFPGNREAEVGVLGSILLDNDCYAAISWLPPEAFTHQDHRKAWEAMTRELREGRPADVVTVSAIAGVPVTTLAGWIAETPTAAHAEHYARIVNELLLRRKLIGAAGEIAKSAHNGLERPVTDILDEAERGILAVRQERPNVLSMKPALDDYWNKLLVRRDRAEPLGLPTGLYDLDRMTKGLRPAKVIFLGGRPGIGKTFLTLSMVYNVSVLLGKRTLIFSLDMVAEELVNNLLARETGIHNTGLEEPWTLPEADWEKATLAVGKLAEAPILIEDKAGMSVESLAATARNVHAKMPLDLIVLDYVQLLMTKGRAFANRTTELEYVVTSLRHLARELWVPIVILSQLTRASEGNERPQLRDLLGSGALEAACDVALLLWRADYFSAAPGSKKKTANGLTPIEAIVAKNRGGPTGVAHILGHFPTCRFESASKETL